LQVWVKTLQVFVSHTSDMAQFPRNRPFVQAALDAVGRARMAAVDMRYFAARDGQPADFCQQQVLACDVYVAVVGFRYGSIVAGEGVSYTEWEFLAAGAGGLPRLVFMLAEEACPPSLADPDVRLIQGFRKRLSGAGLLVREFTSSDSLELEVFHALSELANRPVSIPAGFRISERVDSPNSGSYATAAAVDVTAVTSGRRIAPRRLSAIVPGAVELDHSADVLASFVKDQWARAAADRGLLQSEPIPVRWRESSLGVTGSAVEAARSSRFQPIPGIPVVTRQRLRSGQISDLHAIYGGLGSGRLMIIGSPGAGKSGAAVLLLLAALRHREAVPQGNRGRVPVPVMFTLHGWDPQHQRVHNWIALQLRRTYPLFDGKAGGRRASGLLAAGKIAVILDGLDEIPAGARPVALQALNQQADFRLVVLTRSAEVADAAARGYLNDAAALELQGVDAVAAATYLTRVQRYPTPQAWRELTDELRRSPASALAQALSSPLTLTLVRDTYRLGDDIREFLEFCTAQEPVAREQIVDHLLDRVLPAAYARSPGDPQPRYDLETAERTLGLLATQMNEDGTRDLLWWRIRNWVPPGPRVAISALAVGLVSGIGAASVISVSFGLVAAAVAVITFGVLFGFRDLSPSETGPRPMRHVFRLSSMMHGLALAGLPAALIVGFPVGLAAGLPTGVAAGLAFGLAVGIGFSGILYRGGIDSIEAMASLSPAASWKNGRAVAMTTGLALGVAAGLSLGLADGVEGAPAIGLGIGFTVALGLWRIAARIVDMPTALVIGISAGVADGVMISLTGGHALGIPLGLAAGLVGGLVLGLLAGLMYSRTWSATLAFAQLKVRGRTPFRLMSFLEDARTRNVLRTVGPIYQFRHARLQDRLAEKSPDIRPSVARRKLTRARADSPVGSRDFRPAR
jgi:hypothetical protein